MLLSSPIHLRGAVVHGGNRRISTEHRRICCDRLCSKTTPACKREISTGNAIQPATPPLRPASPIATPTPSDQHEKAASDLPRRCFLLIRSISFVAPGYSGWEFQKHSCLFAQQPPKAASAAPKAVSAAPRAASAAPRGLCCSHGCPSSPGKKVLADNRYEPI